MLKARLQNDLRENRYDESTGTLTISDIRAQAVENISGHYKGLFMDDAAKADLREAYSIPANTVKDEERMRKMNTFFFWTSWACITNRPNSDITYTNN